MAFEVKLKPMDIKTTIEAAIAIFTGCYTIITWRLLREAQRTRKADKMPCVIIRSRRNPPEEMAAGMTGERWDLRLVNVGSGPAFIDRFETNGVPNYTDGQHVIDQVIGPDVGDPDLQIAFAEGGPDVVRNPKVKIGIRYHDIYGQSFETIYEDGRVTFPR